MKIQLYCDSDEFVWNNVTVIFGRPQTVHKQWIVKTKNIPLKCWLCERIHFRQLQLFVSAFLRGKKDYWQPTKWAAVSGACTGKFSLLLFYLGREGEKLQGTQAEMSTVNNSNTYTCLQRRLLWVKCLAQQHTNGCHWIVWVTDPDS